MSNDKKEENDDLNQEILIEDNWDLLKKQFQTLNQSFAIINEKVFGNFSYISEIIRKHLVGIIPKLSFTNYFSDLIEPLNRIYKDFSIKITKFIPTEWAKNLLTDLKDVRKLYLKKLIKAYTIFKIQLIICKNDNEKRLILLSQFILYLSSIFENYTKRILKIFKNQPDELKQRLYRDDISSTFKEFYDPIEINYARLFGFLFNIADNIKHEDSKYYKRYSDFSCEEILNESNELYLDLKLYLKNSLVSFFIYRVRLYHLKRLT